MTRHLVAFILVLCSWSLIGRSTENPVPATTKYDAQMRALQASFCGAEKQEEITTRVQRLVATHLAAMPPERREKLHEAHVVEAVMTSLWTTFHVKELCLEHSERPFAKWNGGAQGFGAGILMQTYGINTAIHELGHAVTGQLCWCATNPDIHVVKFDVLRLFLVDLFNGHGSLETFANFLNPFGTANPNGMSVLGWTKFNGAYPFQLTTVGAGLGSGGSQAFVLLAGVVFTTIAQITGIIIGLNIRERYPTLGYGMIAASLTGYTLELINWVGISMGSASTFGGSDLFRAAVILGVAPGVISGVMVGATAVMVATYVAIYKYLKYLRELRVSAHSLLDEGFLGALKGKETNFLDELMSAYPHKERFDRRLRKFKDHMERVSQQRIEDAVNTMEKSLLAQAEGKEDSGSSIVEKLPDRETFGKLVAQFRNYRQIKKLKNELAHLYRYIATSSATISVPDQNLTGKAAIEKVMEAKFFKIQGNRFWESSYTSYQERKKLMADYLTLHPELPLKKMVNANVKRLKSNQSLAKNFSTTRWCEIIDKGGYKELAEQKGTWFKFRHLSYKRYVLDLRYDLEKHVEQFASAKMSNDAEKMTAISKEVVKDLFLIPKEKRDIPATMAMLTTYVEAVQAQERIHLQKNWYLEIKDKESCESEVKFLCALGKLFHQSHTLKQNSFACSLNPRTACMELGSDRHRLFGPAMQVAER